MIAAAESLVSPQAHLHPYIRTAPGQPASCRILLPPRCLPCAKLLRSADNLVSIFGFEVVGRVLDAVKNAGGIVPDNFYISREVGSTSAAAANLKTVKGLRNDLSIALNGAASWSKTHIDLNSDKRASDRYDSLGKVEELALTLAKLLDSEKTSAGVRQAVRFPLGDADLDLGQLISGLRGLADAADAERLRLKIAGLHTLAPLTLIGSNEPSLTAAEEFVIDMEAVFRKFFRQEPKIQKDEDGNPHGPFIAFVQAAGEAQGRPTTAEAIEQARKRARRKLKARGDN